ncbi:MAG: hypothetical protein GKR97_21200 [Rhizobiaceae bacterium]|nr:hypothetical protein [Rhizobiaceae bacterium]
MKKLIVIAANFVMPGTGSLIAGQSVRGFLQLLIVALAVLLWLTISLKLGAIPLIIFAWIWGMFTALDCNYSATLFLLPLGATI